MLETTLADLEASGLLAALDEAHLSKYHLRAALTTGVGFFTDAYDLFVIGAVLTILKGQWHLGPTGVSMVGSAALLAAFFGAFVFGRIADTFGRRKVYGLEAAIMVVGAIGSAFAPDLAWLVVFRFVIGVGIGGDYPVSAVLMSEYANRRDRGKLVGLVFSMQALGLIVGPLVGISLVASHVPAALTWRLMLGLGAIPAAGVIVARRRLPESPRFKAEVQGRAAEAAAELARLSGSAIGLEPGPALSSRSVTDPAKNRLGMKAFVKDRRLALTLLGTAGTWFLFDYAYYGNSISTPVILRMVAPHASLLTTLTWTLGIFAVAALPGYLLAAFTMDRVGHRRLQLIGFAVMAAAFLTIGVVPEVAAAALPFLGVYGISYFFSEFGPNTTTFVMASEVFPVSLRTTGHGISAGIAKVGAFIGVFVFPLLAASLGLRGTLTLTAGLALAGLGLTLVLPEPARRSLEEVSGHRVELAPTLEARTLGNPGLYRAKVAQSTD